MKAWVLHGIGDIRLETVEDPLPGEGQALIRVKAAGICGSDIPRIYRTGAYSHPLVPGHELSGIVETVGAGVSDTWRGQRVGIFPLIPCGVCEPCRKKQFEMCRKYGYIGSRSNGGFAQYVTVPENSLLKLPEQVSYEEAAMLEPMAVAVHAMRRAACSQSDVIAVCGLGTIGLFLLMFLLEAESGRSGADKNPGETRDFVRQRDKILVIGNKEFQRRRVVELGLPESCYCDSRTQDAGKWIMERTEGRGADVFFECVGKNETVTLAVKHTAPAGRVVLVGNPFSDMCLEKAVYWKILRSQLTVAGTWNSSFTQEAGDDWHYVLDRLSQRRIAPEELISHRFSLEELESGMKIMRDKTEDYVKIMGTF